MEAPVLPVAEEFLDPHTLSVEAYRLKARVKTVSRPPRSVFALGPVVDEAGWTEAVGLRNPSGPDVTPLSLGQSFGRIQRAALVPMVCANRTHVGVRMQACTEVPSAFASLSQEVDAVELAVSHEHNVGRFRHEFSHIPCEAPLQRGAGHAGAINPPLDRQGAAQAQTFLRIGQRRHQQALAPGQIERVDQKVQWPALGRKANQLPGHGAVPPVLFHRVVGQKAAQPARLAGLLGRTGDPFGHLRQVDVPGLAEARDKPSQISTPSQTHSRKRLAKKALDLILKTNVCLSIGGCVGRRNASNLQPAHPSLVMQQSFSVAISKLSGS
jgi:hypothetical protein